jgi:DNA-binding transcriptional ArsR family regulator
MPNDAPLLTEVFHALADPTRMGVVERLGRGPASVTELAEPFPMALPSFTQHLGVLEKGGLVRSVKRGRIRTYYLEAAPLAQAQDWMDEQRRLWERRLDQLDAFVMAKEEETK